MLRLVSSIFISVSLLGFAHAQGLRQFPLQFPIGPTSAGGAAALQAKLSTDAVPEVQLPSQKRTDIQTRLAVSGFFRPEPDSQFGPDTRLTIKRYQQANDLSQSDVLTAGQRQILQQQPSEPPHNAKSSADVAASQPVGTQPSSQPAAIEACSGALSDPKIHAIGEEMAAQLVSSIETGSAEDIGNLSVRYENIADWFLQDLQKSLRAHLSDPSYRSAASRLDKQLTAHVGIGVQIKTLTPETSGPSQATGVVVTNAPTPLSPAFAAGIDFQDVITAANGQSVKSAEDLKNTLSSLGSGTTVSLDLLRHGQKKTVTVKLAILGQHGEVLRDVEDPSAIRMQITACFPALRPAVATLKHKKKEFAQQQREGAARIDEQNKKARDNGFPDCRAMMMRAMGPSPIIDNNVLPILQNPKLQALANDVAQSLQNENPLPADIANPPAAVARLAGEFRMMLNRRAAALQDGILQSWLANMTTDQTLSCFPDLIPTVKQFGDKIKVAAEAAQTQQEEAAVRARRPGNVLITAYEAYQFVKECHDAREGYAAVYISEPEMQKAKDAIKQIEAVLKPQLDAGVKTDDLWGQTQLPSAVKMVRSGNFQSGVGFFCHQYLNKLSDILKQQVPQTTTVKKDF